MAKRLRGWALKKETGAADTAQSASSSGSQSPLATKLLSLWAHGKLSAVLIQELAHLALLDGATHPELAALAKAGNYGEQPGNVHKAIVATFCKKVDFQSHEVIVPCIDPKTSLEEETKTAIYLPHIMFWNMATAYEDQFAKLFSTEDLEKFWTSSESTGDDRLMGHPMKARKDWRQKTVPLFLHGDGVEFQERDSLMVWSWGSVLSLFSSLDSHFLMSCFPKSCTATGTWEPVMKWLVWSFNALQKGRHPELDPDGNPLEKDSPFFLVKGTQLAPGGFRGVLWSIQGDHEFFSNVLQLPHGNNRSLIRL